MADITVDPSANALSAASGKVQLEPKVMQVLVALAQAGGQVFQRAVMLDLVWQDQSVSDEVLTRAISQIRKACKTLDPDAHYIETISKSGYRMAPSVVWDTAQVVALGAASFNKLTHSKEAYQLYQQGRSLNARINGRTELPVARKLLLEAITLDPYFAEAHSELANCCTLIGTYIRHGATLETFEETEFHSRRALELKPGLAAAMVVFAIALFTRGKMVEAIRMSEQAALLEPLNAEAVMRLGYFFAAIGHARRAIPLLERAVDLDPAQGRNVQVLALAKLANGDLDEAEVLALRAIDLHHYFAHDTYSAVAFARGDHEEAYQRFLRGWDDMKWMFDELYDENSWNMTAKLGSSADRNERLTLTAFLLKSLGGLKSTPEVPLFHSMMRCGDPENLFKLAKIHMPIGRHGSFLSMWADTEPCRDIYTHADFPDFAKTSGFSAAWDEFGMPDRLVEMT